VSREKSDALEPREDDLDDMGRCFGVDADEPTECLGGDNCNGRIDCCAGDNVGVDGRVVAVWGGGKVW
jgi:hypothetical protein